MSDRRRFRQRMASLWLFPANQHRHMLPVWQIT